MFATAALAGPMIVMFPQLAPVAPQSAVTQLARPMAAGAAAGHSPALSIAVTDGRQAVRPGDVLTYVIKIHNIGVTNAPNLRVTQTLPGELRLISATGHDIARAGHVTWPVSLRSGQTDTFRVVARVGRTPRQLLRLAAVACATTGSSVNPIVCAAASNQLPAGASASARARHGAATANAGLKLRYLAPAGAGLALLMVIFLAGWLLLRRRARRAS
jgi:uncharacterized repeat protein (TIGR01451 family)